MPPAICCIVCINSWNCGSVILVSLSVTNARYQNFVMKWMAMYPIPQMSESHTKNITAKISLACRKAAPVRVSKSMPFSYFALLSR